MKQQTKKKKLDFKYIVTFIFLFVILGVSVWHYLNIGSGKKPVEIKQLDHIEEYDYVLNNFHSEYFKTNFYELADILKEEEVDEEAYVKEVVTLFVTDFYTLDNKLTNSDVGGIQFVHSKAQSNVILNAKNSYYKYLKSNVYGNREETYEVVKEVIISNVTETEYIDEVNEISDDKAYTVEATWEYEKESNKQTSGIFTVIHEDNKLVIAELKEQIEE